jgi:TonB family protein
VAADGSGLNSPYTIAILETLKEPGLEVRLFWGRVHDRVMSSTAGAQEPFIYGSLGGEALYLNPPAASIPSPPVQYDPRAAELALWQSVQDLGTDGMKEYLAKYPDGTFSNTARLRLAALTRPSEGASASSPGSPIVAPKLLHYAAPEFPQRAIKEHLGGNVTVQFVIDVNGDPRDIRVVEATPPGIFDSAAVAAVKRWAFQPTVVDGKPTEVPVQMPIRFPKP